MSTRPPSPPRCSPSSSGRASWRSRAPRSSRCSIRPTSTCRSTCRSPRWTASGSAGGSRSSSTASPAAASRARSASSPIRPTSPPRRSRRGATAWARSTAPRCASWRGSSVSSRARKATCTSSHDPPARPREALRQPARARRHRPRARAARDRGRRRARRRREDDALARAGRAPRDRGPRGDRPRPRSRRRRDGAQGARRLRPAGLQPPPRPDGRGEPALHGASPPLAGGGVPRARRGAARAHRARPVRRAADGRALGGHEAEAGGRQRAPAAARAAPPRRADGGRRRDVARRDLGAPRARAGAGARPHQHELPRRGGRGRPAALPGGRPSGRGRHAGRAARGRAPPRLPGLGRERAGDRARREDAALRRGRAGDRTLRAHRGAAHRRSGRGARARRSGGSRRRRAQLRGRDAARHGVDAARARRGGVMAGPIIRTRGLTKRFGTFTAVDDLSIEVAAGSIFAFLGANGSGKSTTIRMLIGLIRPTAGAIEVDGVDVRSRALFWELIQEEGEAGATIFVTTHFLEEADYCERVCFIDAGRLIADAPPEELRRRYSGGYRVEVALPPDARAAAAALLGGGATPTEAGVALAGGPLDARVLGAPARLVAAHPEARVSIEQPAMTDVFRRVLAEAGAAR